MNENLKAGLLSLLYIIFYVGLGALWIGGIVHAGRKHGTGDTVISIFLPPWGVYRGAEAFWHNDYAGLDWDKRMKSDYESLLYYLNESDKADVETQRSIEAFSNEINKYPADKKENLKEAGSCYILFATGLFNDLTTWSENFESDSNAVFVISPKTKSYQEKLKSNYNFDEQKTIDAIKQMTIAARNNWESTAAIMKTEYLKDKSALEKPIEVYKKIFNEDYKNSL